MSASRDGSKKAVNDLLARLAPRDKGGATIAPLTDAMQHAAAGLALCHMPETSPSMTLVQGCCTSVSAQLQTQGMHAKAANMLRAYTSKYPTEPGKGAPAALQPFIDLHAMYCKGLVEGQLSTEYMARHASCAQLWVDMKAPTGPQQSQQQGQQQVQGHVQHHGQQQQVLQQEALPVTIAATATAAGAAATAAGAVTPAPPTTPSGAAVPPAPAPAAGVAAPTSSGVVAPALGTAAAGGAVAPPPATATAGAAAAAAAAGRAGAAAAAGAPAGGSSSSRVQQQEQAAGAAGGSRWEQEEASAEYKRRRTINPNLLEETRDEVLDSLGSLHVKVDVIKDAFFAGQRLDILAHVARDEAGPSGSQEQAAPRPPMPTRENFPFDKKGMRYQPGPWLSYKGELFRPDQLQQCREAALVSELTKCELPDENKPTVGVKKAGITLGRTYAWVLFNKTDMEGVSDYGTGQRVQVVVAKDPDTETGDLDTSLAHLALDKNKKATKHLKAPQRKEVEDALRVVKKYLTDLQPFLKQLLGRPVNLLAIIITDPTTQRRMVDKTMMEQPAQQQCPAQAPHTDFYPVGPGDDDGLIFLLAWQDFDLVAYMGSHTLSEEAAPFYLPAPRGRVNKDLPRLAHIAKHAVLQEGTLVHVKAGELVLFRGNTVHAGYLGRPDSCSARLYGFGRPNTVADNTTVNTSMMGPVMHGLYQPTQDEPDDQKMGEWNRRGKAGKYVYVTQQYQPCERI